MCLYLVKRQKCTPTFCQNGGTCKEPEDQTKPPFCICKTNKFVPPNCGMCLFMCLYTSNLLRECLSPRLCLQKIIFSLCLICNSFDSHHSLLLWASKQEYRRECGWSSLWCRWRLRLPWYFKELRAWQGMCCSKWVLPCFVTWRIVSMTKLLNSIG